MKATYPLSRKDNLVVQELKGEVLIYDLSADKAYCLNETSAMVWQACDGLNSVGEISRIVGKKLKATLSDDFIWLALDQLKEENLLINDNEVNPAFAGLSRREVIKKVGLSSMAALPVIAALAAPKSAQAASTCGFIQGQTTCACDPGTGVGNKCTTTNTTGGVTRCQPGCACLTSFCGQLSCIGLQCVQA